MSFLAFVWLQLASGFPCVILVSPRVDLFEFGFPQSYLLQSSFLTTYHLNIWKNTCQHLIPVLSAVPGFQVSAFSNVTSRRITTTQNIPERIVLQRCWIQAILSGLSEFPRCRSVTKEHCFQSVLIQKLSSLVLIRHRRTLQFWIFHGKSFCKSSTNDFSCKTCTLYIFVLRFTIMI